MNSVKLIGYPNVTITGHCSDCTWFDVADVADVAGDTVAQVRDSVDMGIPTR